MYDPTDFEDSASRPRPTIPNTTATYLLGLGPMPPPKPQDLSVAAFYARLDDPHAVSDAKLAHAFQCGRSEAKKCKHAYIDDKECPLIGDIAKARVDVRIPIKAKAPGGMVSTRTVSFEKGIGHGDFFDRVCAYMELPRDKARLGYKWNFERRNDLPHRLLTSEDLRDAFDKAVEMSNSKRRRKVVIMEIVNLDPPIVDKKSAPKRKRGDEKLSDLPATNEFIKLKLHKNANKLRAPHVSSMSVTPQAIDLLNRLPFQTVTDSKDVNTSCDNGDTDIVSDYEHDLTVADVVKAIHLEYPQLNMPQYERALAIQGIIYARSIHDFDQKFYVDIVKMAPGAVGFLIRKALKMAIARRPDAHMGRKARRDEDEDLLHT